MFTVTGVAKDEGEMTHCAKVAFEIPQICITLVAVQPKLTLTKVAPAEVLVCDPIPMRLTVSNPGSGEARDVKITDELPEGLTTVQGDKTVTFNAGTLKRGDSREFEFTAKAAKAGTYVNKAVAVAEDGLKAEATATTVVKQALIGVTKTAPKRTFVEGRVKYDITVANKGDGVAREVLIKDTIPAGMDFISASNRGMAVDDVVTWKIDSLNPGATLSVSVTLRARAITNAKNTVSVTSLCADPVKASAQTQVLGIPAILLEVVDLEDPVAMGQETTYEITATNQGSADGTNIAITCELEENAQYISSVGPTKGAHKDGVITFEPLGRLAAKAKATWRLTVKAMKAGDVRFRAKMDTDQLQRPVIETEATNFYE